MNNNVLIINYNMGYDTFIHKLRELGYGVVILNNSSNQCDSFKVQNIARYYETNLQDFGEVSKYCRVLHEQYEFKAILSHSEFHQHMVDMLAKELDLVHNQPDLVKETTNKILMKERAKSYGIPTAEFCLLDTTKNIDDELERVLNKISFPWIIKPPIGCYSVGVHKVSSIEQVKKLVPQVKRLSTFIKSTYSDNQSMNNVLIEEYIHGEEFNFDGLVIDGTWHTLMLSKKIPDLFGPTFQEEGLLSIINSHGVEEFETLAKKIISAFPYKNAPIHMEIRRDRETNELKVVEFSPRLSGGGQTIYEMMKISAEYDVYDVFMKMRTNALKEVEIPKLKWHSFEIDFKIDGSGIIKSFKGLNEIKKNVLFRTVDITKKIGDIIAPQSVNIDTVAVFYFSVSCAKEAVELLDFVNDTFKVELV